MCQVESRHAYRGLLRREFVLGATLLAAVLLNSEQIKAQLAKLTAEQLLKQYVPLQKGVEYDTPKPEEFAKWPGYRQLWVNCLDWLTERGLR